MDTSVNDIERALAQISDIKAQMAASTHFRGYAPEMLVGIAAISALVMLAQSIWPDDLAASNLQHVLIWGALLVLSNVVIGIESVSRSRWQHGGMAPAMLQSALRVQLPFGAVGVIIAIGICRFAPDAAWIVPGIWQLLIALVAFSSHAMLPRAIVWAALWYSLTGTAAIVLAGVQGHFSGWMMGMPLIVGHLFIAWTLKQEGDNKNAA